MKETIVVDISAAGTVKIDAQGFKGNGCTKATESIQLVLGGANKVTKKPEFFAPNSTAQSTKQTF